MMNFLRKLIGKKKDERNDRFLAIVVHFVDVQLAVGGRDSNPDYGSKIKEDFALGYVFGVCDAAAQRLRLNDVGEAMALFAVAYVKLFGELQGGKFFKRAYHSQGQPEFHRGMITGGADLLALFSNQSNVPNGLLVFLLGDGCSHIERDEHGGGPPAESGVGEMSFPQLLKAGEIGHLQKTCRRCGFCFNGKSTAHEFCPKCGY